MSKEPTDGEFWKSYKKVEGYVSKNANKALEEAEQDIKKITNETKELADKVKDEYRNNYEDIERKAINGMIGVYHSAYNQLEDLAEEARGKPSVSPELQKKVEEVRQQANDQLKMIRQESEKSFEDRAKAQLQEICPQSSTSEDYYKCTLKEAYKKAASLFEEQRKQFSQQSDNTYSNVMREIDRSYTNVIKAPSNKSSSTNDGQGPSGNSKKGSR